MRVIKIVLYLFLLFLVYIWISTFLKSCNSDIVSDAVNIDTQEQVDDLDEDIAQEANDLFEDDATDEEEDFVEDVNYEELDAEEDLEDDDVYEDDIDYEDFDDTSQEVVEEVREEKRPTQSTPIASSSSGNYFVITGSYLLKSNASDMTKKLSRLGHKAEILNFDNSQYHAVTAGRYRSYEDATAVSRKLKGKGIDNYVHRRK